MGELGRERRVRPMTAVSGLVSRMDERASSFDYEALLACGRGELFGEDLRQTIYSIDMQVAEMQYAIPFETQWQSGEFQRHVANHRA